MAVLVQVLPQTCLGASQVHTEFAQPNPVPQFLVQVPQWCELVARSVHSPLQTTNGAEQPHTPAWHRSPPEQ